MMGGVSCRLCRCAAMRTELRATELRRALLWSYPAGRCGTLSGFLQITGWPSALPCVARRSQATQDHHKEAVDAIGDDAPAAKEAKREKKAKKEKKSKSKAEAESAGDADAGAAGAEGKLLTAKERRKLFNKMRRYALSIDDATLCSERR